jgi:hypothetical protein
MKWISLCLISSIFLIGSCTKTTVCEEGIVKDLTGLDGCGLVIELKNGTALEPCEIPAGITLIPNKKVCVSWREKPLASICMVGVVAEITSLEYID